MESLHIFTRKFLLESGFSLMETSESFFLLAAKKNTCDKVPIRSDIRVTNKLLLFMHNSVKLKYLLNLLEILAFYNLLYLTNSISFGG